MGEEDDNAMFGKKKITRKKIANKLGRMAAVCGLLLGMTGTARPFAGEDPLNGAPWHHEDISEIAMGELNFGEGAKDAIAWHADYVDSYLYNPLWWAPGGLSRFKASLSTMDELAKVHFDDLFAAEHVRYMWQRYTSGTVAGLLWAAERGDVAAAQNIIGVGLHAMQDFYSHSNWVDDPNRRNKTFFEMPVNVRNSTMLYTAAYELPAHQGIKHHGKYSPMASILLQPGVKQLMDLASSGFSPLQNAPIMEEYRRIKENNTSVRPKLPFLNDIRVPDGIVYLAPAGIALDNTWIAEIGVRERGLTGVTGVEMFNTAKGLATRQTVQWLKRIEAAMIKAGKQDFWNKVKNDGSTMDTRTAQYEKFDKFPYTFVSAGQYPPQNNVTTEEFYLRVRLKTSNAAFAGTNADIRAKADNSVEKLLDYMPRAFPGIAHDDFEAGDNEVYTLGPYSSMPKTLTLRNDAPSAGDILKSLGHTFAKAGEKIGNMALSLIAGHADHIGTRKKLWMPEDLARVTTAGSYWTIDVNGGDEGHYQVNGHIRRVAENAAEDWAEYKVEFHTLKCIKEAKWDRGSNSDEPFVLLLVSALPGQLIKGRTEPFNDVDKGELRNISKSYTVRLNRSYGVLNVPVSVMEHDDESSGKRDELLDAFAGIVKDETAASERGFLTALDSARAADWKLEEIEVYAFSRNGVIKTGEVYRERCDKWINGGDSKTFNLNGANCKATPNPITTAELLAAEPAAGEPQPENPTNPTNPTPPPPGVPTNPTQDQLNRFLNLKGDWKTNLGSYLTIKDALTTNGSKMLHGQAVRTPGQRVPDYMESMYLELAPGFDSVKGQYTVQPSRTGELDKSGLVYITLSADGNRFEGKVVLRSGTEFPYIAERITGNTNPGNGNTGTVPPLPNNPTNPTNPGNPTNPYPGGIGRIGDGKFRALDNVDIRFDAIKPGRTASTMELFVTFKNVSTKQQTIGAGNFNPILTDPDGRAIRDMGNLYRASGDVPQTISAPRIEPGDELRLRYVFVIPEEVTRLSTIQFKDYNSRAVIVNIADVAVPGVDGGPAATLPGGVITVGGRALSVDEFDITIEGVRKGRGGRTLEVFAAIKNVSDKIQGFGAGTLSPSITDEDGLAKRDHGNLYRVTGETPDRITASINITPGGTVRVRYVFDLESPEAKIVKLTIKGYRPPAQILDLSKVQIP
jgi:hypothetical protein